MRKNKQIRNNELSRRAMLESLEERRLLASIAGTVYEDIVPNPPGDRAVGDALHEDPPVANARVYIDANDNGIWDAGEHVTLTNQTGAYVLDSAPIGDWKLRVEKPTPVWTFVTPAAGFHAVSIVNAETTLTERDFGLNGPAKLYAPAAAEIEEGQVTLDLGNFRDQPGDGPWQITVNWGDGTANTVIDLANAGAIGSADHAYADSRATAYTVTITARDQSGVTGSTTFPATVANVAPTASLINSAPILEGQQVLLSFTNVFDPSPTDTAAGFKYSFDFDNDGTYDVIDSTQPVAARLYTENKIQTVTAQIKDKDGGVTTLATDVVINNVAPTLVVTGAATATVGQDYILNLAAIDPGDDTIITWTIDWGDGSSLTLGKAAQTSHVYLVPGVYAINASATDDDSLPGAPYRAAPLTVIASTGMGTITGKVVNDVDGNGKQAAREKGFANRILYLDYDRNGVWSADEPQSVTTAAGVYTFSGIAAGAHRVVLATPKKWLPSSPSTGYHEVILESSQTVTRNFFMTQRGRAMGTVFLDVNRNRRRDGKDKGLNKWRVFADANEDGRLSKGELSTYSDSTGAFVLNGLTRGTHVLRVLVPKKGYSLTSPRSEEYIIKVNVGTTVKNRNFGAVKIKR